MQMPRWQQQETYMIEGNRRAKVPLESTPDAVFDCFR